MPFELPIPAAVKMSGWKVKIRDKERLEPPHATILFRMTAWRVGLRDGRFLIPPGGSWRDVPSEVRLAVSDHWEALVGAWDRMYPENPVLGGALDE